MYLRSFCLTETETKDALCALSFCLSLGLWPSTAIPLRGRIGKAAGGDTLLLQILLLLGGYAEPLIDFLIRNPLVIEGPERKRLGIHRRIIDGDAQLHVVMVDARVAFLNVRVCAVRNPVTRHPGSFVQPGRIDDKIVVVFPMADRVAHV